MKMLFKNQNLQSILCDFIKMSVNGALGKWI